MSVFEKAEKYLTPKNLSKLEAGQTVFVNDTEKDASGQVKGQGIAMVLINSPAKDVWDTLTDYSSYPQFMPKISMVKVHNRKGNDVWVEFNLKILFKNIRFNTIRTQDKKAGTLVWKMDTSKKNDIKDTHGGWMIRPHGKTKSIVLYTVNVDSGFKVPQKIQDMIAKKDLPGVVQAVKMRVESKGTYKK